MYRSIFAICTLVTVCTQGMTQEIVLSKVKLERAGHYLRSAQDALSLISSDQAGKISKLEELAETFFNEKSILFELAKYQSKYSSEKSNSLNLGIDDGQTKMMENEGKIPFFVIYNKSKDIIEKLSLLVEHRINLEYKINSIRGQFDQSIFDVDKLKTWGKLYKNLINFETVTKLLIAEKKLNLEPPIGDYYDSVDDFLLNLDAAIKLDEEMIQDNYGWKKIQKTPEFIKSLGIIKTRLNANLVDITKKEVKIEATVKKEQKKIQEKAK